MQDLDIYRSSTCISSLEICFQSVWLGKSQQFFNKQKNFVGFSLRVISDFYENTNDKVD